MRVRPARPEDAAAIAEVHVRTWQAAYAHVFGAERLATVDLEQRRARWEERLAAPEPHWRASVAEAEDGPVVAFASAGASRDGGGEGELYAVYALPDAWGSGAGPRSCMRHSKVCGRTASGRILWVLEDNPRARRFYEREGWSLDSPRREEDILGVPITEVRYRIALI